MHVQYMYMYLYAYNIYGIIDYPYNVATAYSVKNVNAYMCVTVYNFTRRLMGKFDGGQSTSSSPKFLITSCTRLPQKMF